MIIYDFDGVMTDNRALISMSGEEQVFINRSDGMAIAQFRSLGVKQMILSSEVNNIVQKRAEKLGIVSVNGIDDKAKWFRCFLEDNDVQSSSVLYIGNDINDLQIMKLVGMSVCPVDAYETIKRVATIILNSRGGYGAVREMLDNRKILNFLKIKL
jgi:3-deoxy-D-manno-octulosonate 8-phosphate phosphatase (KDO 8-P phosphatase)